jgi:hypothetical protein
MERGAPKATIFPYESNPALSFDEKTPQRTTSSRFFVV